MIEAFGVSTDKTQITTVMLAVRHDSLVAVVAGTQLGMLLAKVSAADLGEPIVRRVPAASVRPLAALLFAVIGSAVMASLGL